MLVRIISTSSDTYAKDLYRRFRSNGPCPYGDGEFIMGTVKDVEERAGGFVFTVEITNPAAVEYLRSHNASGKKRGLGSQLKIVKGRETRRRAGRLPYQRVP